MIYKLQIEALNNYYRIIKHNSHNYIIFESDLPLETMEEIARSIEKEYDNIYHIGFEDGYSHGWTDGANDTFNK